MIADLLQAPIAIPPDFWTWLFNNQVWHDFPVVFLLIVVLIGCALAARWFWKDFKDEQERARVALVDAAEKDRIWREEQNDKREQAQDMRDQQWRSTIQAQYASYNQYDRERQETLVKLAASMDGIAQQLKEHDDRAKRIASQIGRVEDYTRPLPGDPGYERRHND